MTYEEEDGVRWGGINVGHHSTDSVVAPGVRTSFSAVGLLAAL